MYKYYLVLLIGGLMLCTACYKLKPVDQGNSSTTTTNPRAEWQQLNYNSNELILNMLGTPFELYAISNHEFARFSRADSLLEKRILLPSDGVEARPILHDNIFARYTIKEGRDIVEFHLTRNPTEVRKITLEDLKSPDDNKVEFDRTARLNGAFNEEGNQFILLTIINFKYTIFLFDIEFNSEHNEFVSLEAVRRLDIDDIPEGEDQLQSVRFLAGNYYITSKKGAYRITPEGDGMRIFLPHQWMTDFFVYNGRIYVTGFNTYDQHISYDNGITWTRLNVDSDLREVEMLGDYLVTHQTLGFPYLLVEDDVLNANPISWPTGIESGLGANNSFYAAAAFNEKFYFSYDDEIYFSKQIYPVE